MCGNPVRRCVCVYTYACTRKGPPGDGDVCVMHLSKPTSLTLDASAQP